MGLASGPARGSAPGSRRASVLASSKSGLRGAIEVRVWSIPAEPGPEHSRLSTARCVVSADGSGASAAGRRSLTGEQVLGGIISTRTKAGVRVKPCRQQLGRSWGVFEGAGPDLCDFGRCFSGLAPAVFHAEEGGKCRTPRDVFFSPYAWSAPWLHLFPIQPQVTRTLSSRIRRSRTGSDGRAGRASLSARPALRGLGLLLDRSRRCALPDPGVTSARRTRGRRSPSWGAGWAAESPCS